MNDRQVQPDSFNFIKKQSKYISLTINRLSRQDEGGIAFLDVMQYLAPGFSLDDFVRSFGVKDFNHQKSYFPYEFMDDFDKLESVKELPPYETFYSNLKRCNVLNSEFEAWCIKKRITEKEGVLIENRPDCGVEKYDYLKQLWKYRNWTCFGDYLKYYNIQDVVPFLKAIEIYSTSLREEGVDMTRDGISLPGLAKQILRSYVDYKTLYYIDNPFVYHTIHESEVGEQSIIFTRKNDDDQPYIKGFDANSLYLHCLGEDQFTGKCIVYKHYVGNFLQRPETLHSKLNKHPYLRDSKEAEQCLSYIEENLIEPNHLVLQRQVKKKLSDSDKSFLKSEFEKGHVVTESFPWSYIVDGMVTVNEDLASEFTFDDILPFNIDPYDCNEENENDNDDDELTGPFNTKDKRTRYVIEYDGCYWHACSLCNNSSRNTTYLRGNTLTIDNIRLINKCRHILLRKRGYKVIVIRSCLWKAHERTNPDVYQFILNYNATDVLKVVPQSPYATTKQAVLKGLKDKTVFGIVVCDLHVPDELKEYFKDFAPIIKHASINIDDVGDFMKEVAERNKVKVKDRRCGIDSYYGYNVGLIDEYLVWLMEKGVVVDEIYVFLRYNKQKVFKNFRNKITELRIKGDTDKSCEMKATTAKLIGNSAFGSCITNKDKFRKVALKRVNDRSAYAGAYTSDELITHS